MKPVSKREKKNILRKLSRLKSFGRRRKNLRKFKPTTKSKKLNSRSSMKFKLSPTKKARNLAP